ncbi:MAG: orotate phosphoribosyltransferase [Actinomycetia bacterium]|nr:orotate phosphoribosyltransferase [Actinomycetes bacterium]
MNERKAMMTKDEILAAFTNCGALQRGHFQLTSGRHSDSYVQCARVLESPSLTLRLARELTQRLSCDLRADVVASPAVGGMLIGFAVAEVLDLPFIFSERKDGAMTLRRGFHVEPGMRVFVVEDVVTTGGSVQEVIALVKAAGGEIAGVLALVDRGGAKKFDAPFYPLLALDVASWEPGSCALCRQGTPLSSEGSRRL